MDFSIKQIHIMLSSKYEILEKNQFSEIIKFNTYFISYLAYKLVTLLRGYLLVNQNFRKKILKKEL